MTALHSARTEHAQLRKEIRELTQQLAKMA